MAEFMAGLGPSLDSLLGHLRIHGVGGLDLCFYVVGAAVVIGFCAAVRSATRVAFLRCSVRK
jgi:hypothetical protein